MKKAASNIISQPLETQIIFPSHMLKLLHLYHKHVSVELWLKWVTISQPGKYLNGAALVLVSVDLHDDREIFHALSPFTPLFIVYTKSLVIARTLFQNLGNCL